jgi:hypothetical protein
MLARPSLTPSRSPSRVCAERSPRGLGAECLRAPARFGLEGVSRICSCDDPCECWLDAVRAVGWR